MEEFILRDNNYHLVGDKWMPRVTAICGMYPKGFGFMKWLGDSPSMAAAEEKRDEAAERGAMIHGLIADLIGGAKVDILRDDLDAWRKLISFQNFWEDHEVEVVATEKFMSSPSLGVAGTCDLIAKVDGKLTVLDWKSGKNLYPSYWLQVAAYAKMHEEGGGGKVEALSLVRLGSKHKRGYELQTIDDPEFFAHFLELFDACKKLWDAENPKGPRTESLPLFLKL